MPHDYQNQSAGKAQGIEEETYTIFADLAASMGIEVGKDTEIAEILDTLDTAHLPDDALKALSQALGVLQHLDTSLS